MKKRIVSLVAAAAVAIGAIVSTMAYTDEQEYEADALNSLGLFLGTDKGYELDKNLTRAEGVTLIVRMYGKVNEATANADKYVLPFTDLIGWEKGYVGYSYANNITKGISATEFAPTAELTDFMFLTFTLRALGYTDLGENAQFVWNNPYELAKTVGLIDEAEADAEFNRGDAVSIFWNALEADLVGKDMTLAESLIAEGVFTADAYAKAIDISDDGKTADSTTVVTEPEDTSAEPEDTTAEPEDTTAEPEDTTAEPEDTTAEPEDTTAEPEDTTAEPEDTTDNETWDTMFEDETELDF